MQAVYELVTVAPYMPRGAKFTRAELDVYVKGYQRAITQALRVMPPAAKRWEARLMRDHRPHLFTDPTRASKPVTSSDEGSERRALVVFYVVFGFTVIGALELLILGAVLIVHLLR